MCDFMVPPLCKETCALFGAFTQCRAVVFFRLFGRAIGPICKRQARIYVIFPNFPLKNVRYIVMPVIAVRQFPVTFISNDYLLINLPFFVDLSDFFCLIIVRGAFKF